MKVHKNIKLITWLNFCSDFKIYSAITILYFTQVTDSFALGLGVFSICTVAAAIFELPTGILSDLVGRKMTVVLGQSCMVLAVLGYALGGSFLVLALGAILEGLSRSFFSGNDEALLYDSLKEDNLEKHYSEYEGKTSSMFQIALGISALVGSVALGFKSFQFLFWLSIIPQVVGLFLALNLVEPKKRYQVFKTNIFIHLKEALLNFKNNNKLKTLSLAQIISYGLGEAKHQFLPAFFATLWPAWAISLGRVLSHALGAFGYRIAGRLIKKLGELKVLFLGQGINFVLETLIIAFPTVLTPLIDSLTSFNFGSSSVAKTTLLQKEFSDHQRATMGSLNSFVGSLFFALAAFILGAWADQVGPAYALLTTQLFLFIPLILYRSLFKKEFKFL